MGPISFSEYTPKAVPTTHPFHAPPLGEIACVFTDIIDSTDLWEHNGQAMWKALQIHCQIIRKELFYSGGYEAKLMGDGFNLIFGNASSCLQFAISTQLELHVTKWPTEVVAYHAQRVSREHSRSSINYNGINVRMGLHWGTPFVSEIDASSGKMDYYGPLVNRASRIQEQAHGGQIAVSDAFILALWRCQNSGEAPEIELTDDFRRSVLLKEICPQKFELKFNKGKNGWVKMKGFKDPMHVTLICCRNYELESVTPELADIPRCSTQSLTIPG